MTSRRHTDQELTGTLQPGANELPRKDAKLAYIAPALTRYGDAKAITRSLGITGALDGGMAMGKTNTGA